MGRVMRHLTQGASGYEENRASYELRPRTLCFKRCSPWRRTWRCACALRRVQGTVC